MMAWAKGDQALVETYGSRVRTLGQGAAQYKSGKAGAQKYFDDVISESPEKMKRAISDNISGVEAYHATVDDVLSAGRKKAAPLYNEAFKANKSITSKEIDRILETPAGRKALKSTAQVMQNDRSLMGLPSKELKAIQRDLIAVGKMDETTGQIASGLNLRTLDAVKKNLDNEVSKLYRSGDSYEAGVLNNLKNSLVRAIDDADVTAKAGKNSRKIDGGLYAKARKLSGDYLQVTKAMDDGKSFMKIDPELLSKNFKKLSSQEKQAYKIGVGKQLRDKIETRTDGSNPYNSIFGSKTQRNRLAKILSPKEFQSLERSLKAENRLYSMRNEILGGSSTAGKQQALLEIAGESAELAQIANGGVTAVPKNAIKTSIKRMFDGLNDDTADQVSKILYETNPDKKLKLLSNITRSKNFTPEQKQVIKKTYFEFDDLIQNKRRFRGASSSAPVSQDINNTLKE